MKNGGSTCHKKPQTSVINSTKSSLMSSKLAQSALDMFANDEIHNNT